MAVPDLDAWADRQEVIVLEGCDGVGKTTLALQLARQHGFQLVHGTRTPDGVDLAERYRTILAQPGRLVLDRCFVSELVYGPLLRNRSRLTLEQAIDLTALVSDRRGLLVHMTASPKLVTARLQQRDGAVPDSHQITAIINAYHDVFAELTERIPAAAIQICQLT